MQLQLYIKGKESLNNNMKAPKCEHLGASMHFLSFTFLLYHDFSSANDVDTTLRFAQALSGKIIDGLFIMNYEL